MALTLTQILALDVMSGATVLTGAAPMERTVRSATVIDAPDAVNWVKETEFVLTSTYPFANDMDAFTRIVEQLASRGVAGFGVKLTRFMKDFPRPALDRAEELGLPVISLPADLAWSDLVSTILGSTLDLRAREVARSNTIHRSFAQLQRSDVTLDAIADLLVEFLNCTILVQVQGGAEETILRSRPSSPAVSTQRVTDAVRRRSHPKVPVEGHNGLFRVDMDRQFLCFAPLTEDEPESFVAAVKTRGSFTDFEYECILEARDTLAMRLMRRRAQESLRQEQMNALVRSMLRPHLNGAKSNLAQLKSATPENRLFEQYTLAIVSFADMAARARGILVSRLGRLLREDADILAMVARDERVTLLFPAGTARDYRPETLFRTLGELLTIHAQTADQLRWAAALSHVSDLPRLANTYEETEQALNYGLQAKGYGHIARADEIGLYRLFSHPAIRQQVQAYVRSWLAPLIDYDRRHNGRLIETLKAFLATNGSFRETARLLNLHHNSVRYRMERILHLTGRDDLNAETRFRFQIALTLIVIQDEDAYAL